jgi:DNA-binding NtrC family response regulator
MTKRSFLLGIGFAAGTLAMASDTLACGDKLVVVGRGRPKRVKNVQAAAILVYADPSGVLPAALDEGNMRKDLERAGHRIRSVSTRQELQTALGTGTYDLLLADYKSVAELEPEAKGAPSHPTVLPTLYNPTSADIRAAEQKYHCVMKAPGQQKDYLAVVNQALAQRAKDSSASKAK